MLQSKSLNLDFFDPQIERTLKEAKEHNSNKYHGSQHMEEDVMRDYAMPFINGTTSSIRRLVIKANHFKIKPAIIIQMIQHRVQFHELSHEDPNGYIAHFLEIYDTFK